MGIQDIRVLVIGLGSMGKRRIRNMQALGIQRIVGFDQNAARVKEVKELYQVEAYDQLAEALKNPLNAFVISVPPDKHHIYMQMALDKGIPAFIEASVVDDNLAAIEAEATQRNVFLAPSCTLFFHPAVKKIREVVETGELGAITNILYHSGQYLPDWHTYENVKDYYVSRKETGGAREIVPFELTWMTQVFGFPHRITGIYKKTIDIPGAESIEDTYNALLDYDKFILNLSVDVVSRVATRRLVINAEKKQLYWNWDENCIKIFDAADQQWQVYDYTIASSAEGYNKNITEQMYIDEMKAFFDAAISGNGNYPNTLAHDIRVLGILYNIEKASNQLASA